MAVVASDQVTLQRLATPRYIRTYYRLQSSTLTPPAAPTTNPPASPWSTTEPNYTEGSTDTLYTVQLTVWGDDSFEYGPVQKSSSYEAAKQAYNAAQAASSAADAALSEASLAQTTADGKNAIYRGSGEPTPPNGGFKVGDLWFRLDTSGQVVAIEVWNGDDWVPQVLAAEDIIAAGTITGALIAGDAIDGKTITGAIIRTAADGQRMETESNQIRFYDPVNAPAGVIRGDQSTNASGDLTWRGVTITDGTYSLGIGYRYDQASVRTVGVYTPNNMRVGGDLAAGNVVILTDTEMINVRDRLLVYGWTNLTLINGWGTDGTHPRIRRDGDWVTFSGRLRGGTGTQFATLPTWARPGFKQRIPVVNNSGVAAESAWIQVDTTGAIHTGGWTANVTVARWMVT